MIVEWGELKEKEEDEYKRRHWEWCLSKNTKTLQELYWHLWGVSDAVEKAGDDDNAKKAEQLASVGVPLKEKNDLLNKRMGENREFKMTQDDLKSVTASQYYS